MTQIWTIGHSNHSFHRFSGLLASERVELVADVRSRPYSRFAPWSGREKLRRLLEQHRVDYVYLGDALGGRPSAPDYYDDAGHALYERIATRPEFAAAIDRLMRLARDSRVALLCSEGRPEACHRRLLVGRVLCERGAELEHILPSGELRREREVPLTRDSLFGTAWRSARPVAGSRRRTTARRPLTPYHHEHRPA